MKSYWHIWVIKQGKYGEVEKFLQTVTEVEEFLYPTVSKEYRASSGNIKKRRVPLYSGYLFIKYITTPETHQKLRAFPFLTTYVGRCGSNDISFISTIKELEYLNTVLRQFEVGDIVKVNTGPFKNFEGEINAVNSNSLTVSLRVFGREVNVSFSRDDVDIIKHQSQ